MAVLLLRFAAPLQSWGSGSKFDRRDTYNTPTKSGIIGLLASSLGIKRNEKDRLADLAESLKIGVRADREGVLLRDFHTAKGKDAYVTNRFYLADAVFLVGVLGNDEALMNLKEAILAPEYPLYLGRRSCPPEGRVFLGIRDSTSLYDTLLNEPLLVKQTNISGRKIRMLIESTPYEQGAFMLKDNPLSFDIVKREYSLRYAKELYVEAKDHNSAITKDSQSEVETTHNPWQELEV